MINYYIILLLIGIGTIPSAIIGGAIGGIIGAFGGEWVSETAIDLLYER